MAPSLQLATVVVGAGVVVGGSFAVASAFDDNRAATVQRVVDGDTVDVLYDGKEQRVRLLNVDTPESVDPNSPVECLGPEATAYLEQLLPSGTEVELRFDEERTDKYDRLLAGVFLDDTLVNAQIARAGFGIAVVFEPNDRYYDDVKAAQDQARSAGAGLYDQAVGCTVPAQVSAFEAAAQGAVAASVGSDVASLEGRLNELTALAVTGAALADVLVTPHGVPAVALAGAPGEQVKGQLAAARQSLGDAQASVTQARDTEVQRLEEERRAAEEAARVAAEREAARQAAEQEAARQAAEQAARQAAEDAEAERVERSRVASKAPATTGGFANCSEARAAGAAPVRVGDAGYSRKLDRDGDGVGCES